jgi:hypothetical protein
MYVRVPVACEGHDEQEDSRRIKTKAQHECEGERERAVGDRVGICDEEKQLRNAMQ